jgi:hypothetical protein
MFALTAFSQEVVYRPGNLRGLLVFPSEPKLMRIRFTHIQREYEVVACVSDYSNRGVLGLRFTIDHFTEQNGFPESSISIGESQLQSATILENCSLRAGRNSFGLCNANISNPTISCQYETVPVLVLKTTFDPENLRGSNCRYECRVTAPLSQPKPYFSENCNIPCNPCPSSYRYQNASVLKSSVIGNVRDEAACEVAARQNCEREFSTADNILPNTTYWQCVQDNNASRRATPSQGTSGPAKPSATSAPAPVKGKQ